MAKDRGPEMKAHGHDHGNEHGFGRHDHTAALRGASKKTLISAFVLIAGFAVAEVVGGIVSGSLALIADAGHMLTDAAAIGLAVLAIHFAAQLPSARRTFGFHRAEIIAAFINALALCLIAGWVVIEAFRRFGEPPEVRGVLMLGVGVLGLVVNIAAAVILRRSAEHSMNVEGAFRHVMADLLGSVGVVISGALIWAFDWRLADPIVSVVIAALILLSTWKLLSKVVHVLLEGTPEHIDMYRLCSEMERLEGVTLIHDIHVWTITQGYVSLTAHVLVDPLLSLEERENLLRQLRDLAREEFEIQHITIQIETSVAGCIEDHHEGHLEAHSRADLRERPTPSAWEHSQGPATR